MPKISKVIPITVTSPNVKEHWSKVYKRNKIQYRIIWHFMPELEDVTLPCAIKFTRISPREIDSDNNVAGFKGIRDSVCALITGKKRGIGDNDPQIAFSYAQEKGEPSVYIEVWYGADYEP